jgi:aspartyl/asparaginyl beta-hydroxylase (cupin superfamily)
VYQRSIGRGEGGQAALPSATQPALAARGRAVRRARFNRIADRVIGEFSLVPVAPVLDVRAFGWTRGLRDNWRAIRDEARAAALGVERAQDDARFTAWPGVGRESVNAARCPATAAAVAAIPGLDSAGFAVLPPGAHLPVQRGPTRGLLTCHLGLIVPRDGDARMRVGDRMVRWAEGETLVFDDTYDHEVWNDSGGTGVVLRIRVRRPLRQPGRWFADTLLRLRSALHR